MSNSIFSQHTRLSEEVFRRFMELPQGEAFQAEYICECSARALCAACLPARAGLLAGTITACARTAPCALRLTRAGPPRTPTGIGGSGQDLRCKTRTVTKPIKGPEDL